MLIRIFTANNDRNKVKKQVWCSGIVARRLRIIVQEHLGKSCLRMKIQEVIPMLRAITVCLSPPPKFHYHPKVKIYFVCPLFEQSNRG